MEESNNEETNNYTLHPIKPSEVPTRGKLKATAIRILNDFYNMPKKNVEVLNKGKPFKTKKELITLYDALKAVIRKDKLNVEVRTEKGRLFLSKRD